MVGVPVGNSKKKTTGHIAIYGYTCVAVTRFDWKTQKIVFKKSNLGRNGKAKQSGKIN